MEAYCALFALLAVGTMCAVVFAVTVDLVPPVFGHLIVSSLVLLPQLIGLHRQTGGRVNP